MANYNSKIVKVEDVLKNVKSSNNITTGLAAAEPIEFMKKLHTIADRVEDVTITNCLPMVEAEYLQEKYFQKSFKIDGWFFTPLLRKLQNTGRVSFVPNCLHYAAKKRNDFIHTDIFIASASMPDSQGNVRVSCSNVYEIEIAKKAGLVFFEISPNIPYVHGDAVLQLKDVDGLIESDYFLPTIPEVDTNEKDKKIGQYISELINDGDTIQIGIGGIPNAVCTELAGKKHLGVHTEMLTTGIVKLMQSGVVDNSQKTLEKGKTVFAFMLGSEEMYKFAHNNKDLAMKNGAWTNHPFVIAQNDNMVSVNTTIEIDLTGQCCSESIGYRQISGTGGQSDTAIGAQEAKNGRSIIALYSTVTLKNQDTGEINEHSKVVPVLKEGAAVTLSRNDVDYVVTEYGYVRLRGLSIQKRAEKLISIAHPNFRDELRYAAKKYLYWM